MSAPAQRPITREALVALDRADPLGGFRDRFALPPGVIYLDGNSLGALPAATPARLAEVLTREWGEGLIRSWNQHGWIDLPLRLGDKIARLTGAPPGSVIAADSTSVNLFKALSAALALRPERRVILSQPGNFPTDLYIAEGLARLLGRDHVLRLAEPEALDSSVAVLMLTQVDYRSGRLLDMAGLTAAAHAAGALVVWDLSHSAGVVPIDLAGSGADFAVGCGYKYLNGGPGAPGFLYVAPALHARLELPMTGWLGHAAPFAFEPTYRPAPGIARAAVGTPPILGLSALEVGLDLALAAPIAEIRAKSLRQTALFAQLVAQECDGLGLRILLEPERGSQVALAHPQAYPIMQALIASGVIGDVRAPDILRFGFAPLYVGFAEIWDAVQVLREVLRSGVWREARFQTRAAVT